MSGGPDEAFGKGLRAAVIDEVIERSLKPAGTTSFMEVDPVQLARELRFIHERGLDRFLTEKDILRLKDVNQILNVLPSSADMGGIFAGSELAGKAITNPIEMVRTLVGQWGVAQGIFLNEPLSRALINAAATPAGQIDRRLAIAVGGAMGTLAADFRNDRDMPEAMKIARDQYRGRPALMGPHGLPTGSSPTVNEDELRRKAAEFSLSQ
jgi:hypothetical protein